MLRQTWITAFVAFTALGSLTVATAQEPGKKQIINSIGMKLVLIPKGEFKMGSGESAEETAAFFSKNYGENRLNADSFKDEHPQHRVRITKPFYPGRLIQALRPEDLLIANLDDPEYLEILCGGNLDNLPALFARNWKAGQAIANGAEKENLQPPDSNQEEAPSRRRTPTLHPTSR